MLLGSEEHHPLEMGVLLAVEVVPGLCLEFGDQFVNGLHVVDVPDAVDEVQVLHIGLPEDVVELRGLVVGVDGEQDGTDLGGGEHECDPIGDVGGPYGDLFTFLDAHGHHSLGHTVDLDTPLPPREAEVPVDVHDGVVVGVVPDALVQEVPESLIACDVLPGYADHLNTSERGVEDRVDLCWSIDCTDVVGDDRVEVGAVALLDDGLLLSVFDEDLSRDNDDELLSLVR